MEFTSNNIHAPKLIKLQNSETHIQNAEIGVKFEGRCLKQDKVTFDLKNLVNLFLVCV